MYYMTSKNFNFHKFHSSYDRSIYRKFSIDVSRDEEKIEKQLMKLVKRSEKDGAAIGIGHVKPKTLNVLSDQIP